VADDSALSIVDAVIEHIGTQLPDRQRLHDLGRWLATTASDRGAVKVGLALLGAAGVGDALDVVRTLGAHDEFTLYAAVALTNGLAYPDEELWALAATVDGWGRIQCVERLRGTTDPRIRAWILREGFRNSVMVEYLAYIAAETGGLVEALRGPGVDRDLLTAAGEILQALVVGGPAEDMDDYDSGADAVEAYLGLMLTRAETLGDLQAIYAIRDWLSVESGWEARRAAGWNEARRDALGAACTEIIDRPEWEDRIAVALLSHDAAEFWQAEQVARARGVDTFDVHVSNIEQDPLGADWFAAWQQADRRRAEQLAALARARLPLAEIATGPADALGLGPEWRAHMALDWTLQALPDHVGVGPELVTVGLRSPATRNRTMAMNVLKAWPPSAWPSGARALVEQLSVADPNDHARELAGEVLRGCAE
jgi:hypothetical protein